MGEIVQTVADRYGNTKGVYISDAGYNVPVEPKIRTKPDLDDRHRHVTIPDYTLEQLEAAEKEYVKLVKHVEDLYSGSLKIVFTNVGSRIALVQPLYAENFGKRTGNSDPSGSSLFVLNLQTGLVYNLPVTRLGELVGKDVAAKYVDGGNIGFSVDDALSFVADVKQASAELFNLHGHVMSDDDFALLISLFRLRTVGLIFGDAQQWVKYIIAGLNITSVEFAFNKKMWGGHGAAPVPVDQIEQFKDLPVEWARKLIIA